MFAIGVGHWIYEHYDVSKIKFLASSSGCFAAVPLACGMDPYEWCKKDWGKCMKHFESRGLLGCLYDSKHFYYNLWNEYLPDDAHIICSGRLFVSVTAYPSMKNMVISEFLCRDDLLWAITASMCLPYVFMRDFPVNCGPKFGDCIDGGFSNDSPCLDSYTITVSALMPEADIVPVYQEDILTDLEKGNTAKILSSEKEEVDSNLNHRGSGSLHHVQSSPALINISVNQAEDKAGCISNQDSGKCSASGITKIDDSKNNSDGNSGKITFLDVIRTPEYARVWFIGSVGELSASQCADFLRHEWVSILRPKLQHINAKAVHKSASTTDIDQYPSNPTNIPMTFNYAPNEPLVSSDFVASMSGNESGFGNSNWRRSRGFSV